MKFTIAFLAFFLLLTHASPGDEDFCTQFLGDHILFQDCYEAFKNVPKTVPGDLPGPALTSAKLFSREPNTPARFKLPQTWTSGGCVINLDMADGVDYAATTWDFQRARVKKIIDYCVQPHGIGGRVMLQATTIEIRSKNKSKPKPATAVAEHCLAIPMGSKTFQCLMEANNAAEGANIALNDFSDHISELTYRINRILGPHSQS